MKAREEGTSSKTKDGDHKIEKLPLYFEISLIESQEWKLNLE